MQHRPFDPSLDQNETDEQYSPDNLSRPTAAFGNQGAAMNYPDEIQIEDEEEQRQFEKEK